MQTRAEFLRRATLAGSSLLFTLQPKPPKTVRAAAFSNLQSAFDETAHAGHVLLVSEKHVLEEGLKVPSGLRLTIAASGSLIRNFSSDSSIPNSLLRNPVHGVKITDVVISGPGTLGAANLSLDGTIIGLFGDHIHIGNVLVDGYVGRALDIGGDHNRVIGFRAINSSGRSGAGGVRMVGGTDFVAQGCHVDSGDDSFQFVPSANPAAPYFDRSISNSMYLDCTGRSRSARLLVVGLVQPPSVTGLKMSASITNVEFRNCSGLGGRRGIAVVNDDSTGDIDGVTFTSCSIDMSAPAQVQGQDVLVGRGNRFSGAGRVRRIAFSGLKVKSPAASLAVVEVVGEVEQVSLNGLETGTNGARATPVYVASGSAFEMTGGVIDGVGRSGSAVLVGSPSGRVAGVTIDGTQFTGLPDGGVALDLNDVDGAQVTALHVAPSSGAANVKVVRVGRPSSGCVLHDIDATAVGGAPFEDLASDASTVIRNCPGFNPVGRVQVSVPSSGVPVPAADYDRNFRITAGASDCTVRIGSGSAVVVQSGQTAVVHVPAATTLTATYAKPPAWTVEGL